MVCFSRIITSVRDTCADWLRGQEPADDPALKGKKDPSQGYNIKVPRRRVGPSSTQVSALVIRKTLAVFIWTPKNKVKTQSYLLFSVCWEIKLDCSSKEMLRLFFANRENPL